MKALNCDTFRKLTFHFQADELSEEQRLGYLEHLDACADCARYQQTEESFARFLRGRLRREPAPAALRVRIRDALDRETPPRRGAGLWPLIRSPGLAAAAASLILALALGPALVPSRPGRLPGGEVVRVQRAATVVDLQCDRAGRPLERQPDCRDDRHFNALKVADGNYWNLSLGQSLARELVMDRRRRGERLIVEGDFYPELGTLRIASVRRPDLVSFVH